MVTQNPNEKTEAGKLKTSPSSLDSKPEEEIDLNLKCHICGFKTAIGVNFDQHMKNHETAKEVKK